MRSRAVALVQKLAAVLAVAALIAAPMRAQAPDKRVAQGRGARRRALAFTQT